MIIEKEAAEYYSTQEITNAEFIKMLSQYPQDAIISIECCNPNGLVYDSTNNLIRID